MNIGGDTIQSLTVCLKDFKGRMLVNQREQEIERNEIRERVKMMCSLMQYNKDIGFCF